MSKTSPNKVSNVTKDDAREVVTLLEPRPAEESFEEIYVLVHPGHTLNRSPNRRWYSDDFYFPNIRGEDHVAFSIDLHRRVNKKIDQGIPIAVFYEEGKDDKKDATDAYLGELSDKIDYEIPTRSFAHPRLVGQEGYMNTAELIDSLDDQGQFTVSGELYGLCYDKITNLFKSIRTISDRDYRIKEDLKFPKKRLSRLGYTLHWEEDEQKARVMTSYAKI